MQRLVSMSTTIIKSIFFIFEGTDFRKLSIFEEISKLLSFTFMLNYYPTRYYITAASNVCITFLQLSLQVFIGCGFPYEGPGPLEAMAAGTPFIQPKVSKGHITDFHEKQHILSKIYM